MYLSWRQPPRVYPWLLLLPSLWASLCLFPSPLPPSLLLQEKKTSQFTWVVCPRNVRFHFLSIWFYLISRLWPLCLALSRLYSPLALSSPLSWQLERHSFLSSPPLSARSPLCPLFSDSGTHFVMSLWKKKAMESRTICYHSLSWSALLFGKIIKCQLLWNWEKLWNLIIIHDWWQFIEFTAHSICSLLNRLVFLYVVAFLLHFTYFFGGFVVKHMHKNRYLRI